MDEITKKRFMNSTGKELDSFLSDKSVTEAIPISQVPADEQLLETLCVWVTKFINGKYDKIKARVMIRGDLQMKDDKMLLLQRLASLQCLLFFVLLLFMDRTSTSVIILALS